MAISIEQAFRPTLGLTTVGEYELLALIARGGMGTVYLCRRKGDFGFVRLFALKMLHEHLADEGTYISMFLDEARIGARLHHPNIAAAVDLGTFHGAHYVVMDYVEGCSLADLQTRLRGDLPVPAVLHIVIDALEGLEAAHSVTGDDGEPLGLVHRDVSPGNVLIGVEGTARITDFGVAKLEQAGARTRSSERKGKFAFMSPEQLLDDKVDQRADLFSMGVVLWNALTGRALFGRRNDGIAIHKVLNMPIARPSSMSDRCPAWLDEVCIRALQRDPDRRYQSASEMSSVIREIAASEGAAASPRDVSQLVQRAFSEELESRRLMLRSVSAGAKAQAATATPSRTRAVTSLPTFAPLVTESEWTANPLSDTRRTGLRRRPALLWLSAIGFVAVLSAGAVGAARFLGGEETELADRGGEASPGPAEASPPPTEAARPTAEPANQAAPAPTAAASIEPPAPEPAAGPDEEGTDDKQGKADRQEEDTEHARSRRSASPRRATARGQSMRRERKVDVRSGGDAGPAAAGREAGASEPEEKAPPTDNVDPWRKR